MNAPTDWTRLVSSNAEEAEALRKEFSSLEALAAAPNDKLDEFDDDSRAVLRQLRERARRIIAEQMPPVVDADAGVKQPITIDSSEANREQQRRRLVRELAERMHRGHHWRHMMLKSGKVGLGCDHSALTDEAIEAYVAGGSPVGLCPIVPGCSTTRTALLDFDSHAGEVPWEQMAGIAQRVAEAARSRGLHPNAFRSSGGNGIHLLFVWREPQDAYTVRQVLTEVLASCSLKPGTKGVARGTVEVFPKQDAVPVDGFGNMWVLPFARKSAALDDTMTPTDSVPQGLAVSAALTTREKPQQERASSAPDAPELERVVSAVESLKPRPFDYQEWRSIVFAIHDATQGSEAGLQLAQWFNDKVMEHDKGRDWLSEQVWPYIRFPQPGAPMITVGSLFHKAREDGWLDPKRDAPLRFEGFEELVEPNAPGYVDVVFYDMGGIDLSPPPARDWIIKYWLARGILHMFFAKGGKGKSLLMQQLASAVSTGGTWLGQETAKGKVMGFFCEEDNDELARRQMSINASLMLTSADIGPGLLFEGRLGHPNNLLMVFDDERKAKRTKFLRRMRELVMEHRPDVLIVDNIAQTFGGVENDRTHVTQFANELAGIARESKCAVILLGHVAKAQGSEYSGSTAWENVARVRWMLTPEDDGTSTLSIAKTNIGPEQTLTLRWNDGVFHRIQRGSPEAYEIIEALATFTAEKLSTSHNARASTYLPKMMIERKLTTQPKSVLTAALGRMIARGDALPETSLWRRANGAQVFGIALSEQARNRNPLDPGDPEPSPGGDGTELL
jgi:replicative DNA helicase